MFHRTLSAIAAAVVIVASPVAVAQVTMGPATTAETTLGTVLAGANGMTLYTYDNDELGVTNCYDECAINWPPFLVEDNADLADEDWMIIERTDGTQMWAYQGQPLYYFANDENPGDVTGDGAGDVWHVVIIE